MMSDEKKVAEALSSTLISCAGSDRIFVRADD